MINGWIRDDLNLWQHISQYSEVTEQSEYLTHDHRLHTFCLIVVLLNSCLKTVAQLFMLSTTPGCLWCSMIYLLRDIGWSPRYTLHVTQLRHVKLAVSWPRAGTRYPVSPHIHWFIVQKTTASLCPPHPSAAPSQVSELSHIILQLLIMAAHYPDIYGDDSSLQWS